MEVMLEPEETQTLIDVLRSYSSDLRMEIADTDNPGYKRPLKHQREVIDAIVDKLKTATTSETPDSVPVAVGGSAVEGAAERVSLRIVAVW
jgi:hypothetical protein